MNILALDTSTEFLSLALQVGAQTYTHFQQTGSAASQRILPEIQALLEQANVTLHDLDGIAFGAGPGAFTGVRVACGVTQGLAYGANLPVVGINTLLAVAQTSGADKVIVCQDARMGEVYHAAFVRDNEQWLEVCATGVYPPEKTPLLEGENWAGVGSGWAIYDVVLTLQYQQNINQKLPNITPTAQAILQLAMPAFVAGTALPAAEAKPVYIRNRVALTSQERAQGMRL